MAQPIDLRVDPVAVRTVADRFDSVADSVARAALVRPRFSGATAGRAYVHDGDAVHRGLELCGADLAGWARAAQEVATGLRCGADRYAEAERAATGRIG